MIRLSEAWRSTRKETLGVGHVMATGVDVGTCVSLGGVCAFFRFVPTVASEIRMSWRQPVQQHDVAVSFANGGEDEPSVGRP
jgi:hypothetical protein